MKILRLVIILGLALSLAGCSWQSGNSDDDSIDARLIEVQVDARDFSTTEISTCPVATQVGTGSCNAVLP